MQVAALEAAGMIELNEAGKKCWKGYEKKGTKMMFGKRYNNCVKKEEVEFDEEMTSVLVPKAGVKFRRVSVNKSQLNKKSENEKVDEGIIDTVKDVGKKVIKKTKEFINKPIIAPTLSLIHI